MNTAIKIKDMDWQTDAALYKLSKPMKYEDIDTDTLHSTDYVVVSAVIAPFTGPETYIFPCDENGEVYNMLELEGSFRGGLDHERALRNAGYHLIQVIDNGISANYRIIE